MKAKTPYTLKDLLEDLQSKHREAEDNVWSCTYKHESDYWRGYAEALEEQIENLEKQLPADKP